MAERLGWIEASAEGAAAASASAVVAKPAEWEANASTVLWFGTEKDGMLAVLAVADKIRDEAAEAIAKLNASGIQTIMLTGDNKGTALAVQRQTGVSSVEAGLKPQDKVTLVTKYKATCLKGQTIAMVGDGEHNPHPHKKNTATTEGL